LANPVEPNQAESLTKKFAKGFTLTGEPFLAKCMRTGTLALSMQSCLFDTFLIDQDMLHQVLVQASQPSELRSACLLRQGLCK